MGDRFRGLGNEPRSSAVDGQTDGAGTRSGLGEIPRSQRIARQLGFGLLWAATATVATLPRAPAFRFGRAIGRLAGVVSTRQRKRVERHIELAFPDKSAAWRRRLVRATFAFMGENFVEVSRLSRSDPEEILKRVEIEGEEHLAAAREAGRGALLVTGHVGCWELMAAVIGVRGHPLHVIARELYDSRMDRLIVSCRRRFGIQTIRREERGAAREILGVLKRGEILGILIDVDIKAPGAFVPFFGRDAWTPTGAAAFSLRAKAPVVMGFIHREGARYVIRFDPPLPPKEIGGKAEDLRVNTARYTSRIEEAIRRHPEQWVWTHRRWRRVRGPGGEPCLPHNLPRG